MQWSDVTFRASSRVLRQFALLTFVILGAWDAWCLWRGQSMLGIVQLTIAAVVGIVGLVRPQALRWVYGAALAVAFPIGWVVSQAMLLVLFVGVFTPLGIALRLLNRDPLQRRFDDDAESYWEPIAQEADPRRYFQQF